MAFAALILGTPNHHRAAKQHRLIAAANS